MSVLLRVFILQYNKKIKTAPEMLQNFIAVNFR